MVLQVIKDRFTLRNYAEKEVSDEVVTNILEAARLAPSWVNVQPWHFIVIRDRETKKLLSELSHGQPHVAQAPVVIACCGDSNAWEKGNYRRILESKPGITEERVNSLLNNPAFNPKLKNKEAVIFRTIEELTYAIAYMTLEAQNQKVGACVAGFIGNELTESVPDIYKKVREKLNLPANIMLMALLLLGYPAPSLEKSAKIRKSAEEIISREKYGNKL